MSKGNEAREGAVGEKERVAGLDLVRVVAAFFVISVHFFLNSGYYSIKLVGVQAFVMTYGRWLFLTCVPLYMILTGYFKLNKTFGKEHYKSLISILVAYVVISVLKVMAANHIYGSVYTVEDTIRSLLNYQMAWYVGMYLSLMLLIPFLNAMWHALTSKRQKQVLILSLAFISTLYPMVKYVAPSYWQMLYPFVYYFVGAYIREYQPKIKKWLGVLLLLLIVLLEAAGSFWDSNGSIFKWTFLGAVDNGYNAFSVVVCSVIIFLCLYDIQIKTKFIQKFLMLISKVSLEIYLFAGISDAYVYYFAKQYIPEGIAFFPYFLPLVLASFIGAVAASLIYRKIYDLIANIIRGKVAKSREDKAITKGK